MCFLKKKLTQVHNPTPSYKHENCYVTHIGRGLKGREKKTISDI
jgi:hypothetical protein